MVAFEAKSVNIIYGRRCRRGLLDVINKPQFFFRTTNVTVKSFWFRCRRVNPGGEDVVFMLYYA